MESKLKKAEEIQNRLIAKGFTWDSHDQAKAKVLEEIDELYDEINASEVQRERLEDEFGDCLFSLINIACRLGLDSEKCLALAIQKFEARTAYLDKRASEENISFEEADLKQLLKWWKEAKS
jgi:uncharacterized protein YabN with tetrapyrrole methylase and pyrophosphatase domain